MEEVLSEGNKIFTFEPIYSDILLKNIVDNNLGEKIILYPYGAGNKIESVKIGNIDLTSSTNFGGTSIVDTLEDNYNSMKVNLIPVDVLNFDNISLIKIDVENMEIEALEGCINLIKQCKPTILIETYKFNDLVKTDIFKQLTELGYDINPIPEGYCDFIMKIK
jgi:FkbM family methyltransferase